MNSFRRSPNGFVNAALTDAEMTEAFTNLNLLRKDAYSNFELVIKGHVVIETIRDVSRLVGPSFRQFMETNYDSGRAPIAGLIKDIVHYLNGRMGHHSLITSLRIEERKLLSASKVRKSTYRQTQTTGSPLPLLEDGYIVHDYDLYRLMSGISPSNVGRTLLLLGGENYYS
ncbi:hypothetical protein [Pseudomonas aeruginosa]|uniref:hypothetical protein n=1 Tax=Pseudomonas aeruginosa TaxID=287 RepID=UPI00115320BC|nr:hypothetical protein [Pseudomonas aeruginosa]TQH47458.1 hypothetical protein FLI59_32810 [Pseudomonas aeruginosa]